MGKLRRSIGRILKAPSRYGFLWALIYISWAAISIRSLRIPRSLRNRIPEVAGRVFDKLGIESIRVPVNGVKLYIDPRNYWSLREYAFRPHYDFAEISAVKKTVPASYTFIDIGANFGVWSFSLAGHFSRILGVEPDPRCYKCCERSLRKLQLSNVDFVEVALAECDGNGLLFGCESHIGDSRISDPGDGGRMKEIPIELMSFDSLAGKRRIDTRHMFIELDVQGSEPSIVRGMKNSLSKAQDVILFTEIQERMLKEAGFSAQEYTELLRQLGFVPVALPDDLTETSWEDVIQSLGTARDYCFRLTK
jgi:FkbM family methyltransferase